MPTRASGPAFVVWRFPAMLLTPDYIFKSIECISPDFLREKGITALVLDVDNTLTGDFSQTL